MLDQVLGKALESDSNITPRFTTKDENGNIISQHMTIELENPVLQEGSAFNKANMLDDSTAIVVGLDPDSNVQVNDALFKLSAEIGEIRVFSSLRDDLGDSYLLCDGSGVEISDYPTLSALLDSTRTDNVSVILDNNSPKLESYQVIYGGNSFMFTGMWDSPNSSSDVAWFAVYENNSLDQTFFHTSYRPSALAYGNGIFVTSLYGYSDSVYTSKVYYSTDNGKTFVESSQEFSTYVNKIVYANGVFMSAGNTRNSIPKLIYSTDCNTWASTTGLPSNFEPNSLAYGGGRWVTVGQTSGEVLLAYYSTNGTSWVKMTGLPTADDHILYDVIYANGRFVAIGGKRVSSNFCPIAYYSTNGTSWTAMTGLPTTDVGAFRAIAYGNQRFIAVGTDNSAYYSTTGTSWVKMTGLTVSNCRVVDFSNGVFVTAYNANSIFVSYNGTSWVEKETGISSTRYAEAISSHNGVFAIAVDGESSLIYVTPNVIELPTLLDETNQVYGYVRALYGTEDA